MKRTSFNREVFKYYPEVEESNPSATSIVGIAILIVAFVITAIAVAILT